MSKLPELGRSAVPEPKILTRQEKKAAYDRAYYHANVERLRASRLAAREANCKSRCQIARDYRKANPEKIQAYLAANRERIAARSKVYCEANREKLTAYNRAYREDCHEGILLAKKAYREANREKIKAARVAYKQTLRLRRLSAMIGKAVETLS